MKFIETQLAGAYVLEPEVIGDNRGFFARVYSEDEFAARGLHSDFVQCNISFNTWRNTIRGMHYQADPYGEVKLVRCTMGAIYDVILDLRPQSPTFRQWEAVELSAENRRIFYIPTGVAHGFQTLGDNSEVFYMMGAYYHPEAARGVRWDDPAFAIQWHALGTPVISEKDASYPLWEE